MKYRNSFAILAFSAAFLLAGCGEQPASSSAPAASSVTPAETVSVTFNTNGGSSIATAIIDKGAKVSRPSDPIKEGYVFDDWYADEVLATLFDFDLPIYANTTVYAGWVEAAEESSDEEEAGKLYFRDAPWWNNMGAYTVAQFDDGDPEKMEWLAFIPGEAANIGYNYWSIDVPEEATTVTFYRGYDDPDTGEMNIEGPKTNALDLDSAAGNMYDIVNTTAAWDGTPIVGEWGIYDPSDVPEESSGEPATSGEIPSISTKYGLKDIETGNFICELTPTEPNEGYDQAKAENIAFAQGTKFALCDSESEGQPTWVCSFNPWSFGSQGDGAKIPEYLSVGDGYWEVVQDFNADVYAQFKFQADRIYFGLK